MFYRPTWWSDAHHLLMQSWCQPWNITNMSNPALFHLVSSSCLSFPSFYLAAMLLCNFTKTFFFPHAAQLHLIFSTQYTLLSPTFSIVCCPRAGRSDHFLHLEGKGVKLDQALTGLSLYLPDVSTGDVSLQWEKDTARKTETDSEGRLKLFLTWCNEIKRSQFTKCIQIFQTQP